MFIYRDDEPSGGISRRIFGLTDKDVSFYAFYQWVRGPGMAKKS